MPMVMIHGRQSGRASVLARAWSFDRMGKMRLGLENEQGAPHRQDTTGDAFRQLLTGQRHSSPVDPGFGGSPSSSGQREIHRWCGRTRQLPDVRVCLQMLSRKLHDVSIDRHGPPCHIPALSPARVTRSWVIVTFGEPGSYGAGTPIALALEELQVMGADLRARRDWLRGP
jgi:hypothetical protein